MVMKIFKTHLRALFSEPMAGNHFIRKTVGRYHGALNFSEENFSIGAPSSELFD